MNVSSKEKIALLRCRGYIVECNTVTAAFHAVNVAREHVLFLVVLYHEIPPFNLVNAKATTLKTIFRFIFVTRKIFFVPRCRRLTAGDDARRTSRVCAVFKHHRRKPAITDFTVSRIKPIEQTRYIYNNTLGSINGIA